jgi:serine phosphatase RsbU (regulator of sigma subunit)
MFATVVCAVSSPPFDRFRIATAGHPPPVVASPGQAAQLVDVSVDLPLGVASGRERKAVEVTLPRGGALVLYTDGLIERRGEIIDLGLSRLQGSVSASNPETVCRDVLRDLVGSASPGDDIAIVAIQRTP